VHFISRFPQFIANRFCLPGILPIFDPYKTYSYVYIFTQGFIVPVDTGGTIIRPEDIYQRGKLVSRRTESGI